jgi:hypothetical protein
MKFLYTNHTILHGAMPFVLTLPRKAGHLLSHLRCWHFVITQNHAKKQIVFSSPSELTEIRVLYLPYWLQYWHSTPPRTLHFSCKVFFSLSFSSKRGATLQLKVQCVSVALVSGTD